MELSISKFTEKPKQFKFLWSKLSNQDRIERLELIFKDNDVPPYLIENTQDYNSIYLLGNQQDTDFMQIVMQSNFAIPIVDDQKKVYKQSIMKNNDKLITNEITLDKKLLLIFKRLLITKINIMILLVRLVMSLCANLI